MASSSGSSSDAMAEEKQSASDIKDSPSPRTPSPDISKTEAHIIPDTADGTPDLDMEKAEEQAKAVTRPPGDFPDGGLKAWLVVSGAFCCLFCSFGWINCIGVFQEYYQTHQLKEYSSSEVAWIPSLEVFMMFVGGPIWGKLYDRYGPRYLLLVGSFLHVFGLMMASISHEYYQFILSQGICSSIGASLIFYPAMSTVGTWFQKNRAFAFGIMAAGSSLGGVIFPIMVDRLIDEVGFGWSMRIAAFLILALTIYANLTVRSRIPPTPKPWSIREFIEPLQELPFFLVVFASFLFFFGLFIPFNFIILYAEANGMSTRLALYMLAVQNGASVFGRTLPGWIADRIGRFNTMVITSYFSAALVLALWLPSRGNIPIILFAAFYGFASGAFISLAPALVTQISDIRQIGVRTGSMFAVISVAGLVGNPIGGALITAEHGGFTHLQIFCGVVMFGGSCVFFAARTSLVGFKLGAKV